MKVKLFFILTNLLVLFFLIGLGTWYMQLQEGLEVTGLTRDISWGIYISQFSYLVGIAASAIIVVLLSIIYQKKQFSAIMMIGESIAVGSILSALCFVITDLGQPKRILAIFLHPQPTSLMFWDVLILFGYLILSCTILYTSIIGIRYDLPIPSWIRKAIVISIFWAIPAHTITAFLYQGLPDRRYWFSAITAARFFASAFCSGPAVLLVICLLLQQLGIFMPKKSEIKMLLSVIIYAMGANIFFYILEVFTTFYSGVPSLVRPFSLLFTNGNILSICAWLAVFLSLLSFFLLATPITRNHPVIQIWTLLTLILATWLDKGFTMVPTGFIPSPTGLNVTYAPSLSEILITTGIYALGALIISFLCRHFLNKKLFLKH